MDTVYACLLGASLVFWPVMAIRAWLDKNSSPRDRRVLIWSAFGFEVASAFFLIGLLASAWIPLLGGAAVMALTIYLVPARDDALPTKDVPDSPERLDDREA